VSNPNLNRSFKENYVSSQPMLSMVSGRQIYIIKADNPLIGRVCCVEIGMAEVSGIKNLVREGQRINKGDLLGHFRFGGSSHAIIFDNQASNLRFNPSIFQREVSK
jgi:phosphatidylserine decarboxylase